jgi:hypothetical protein
MHKTHPLDIPPVDEGIVDRAKWHVAEAAIRAQAENLPIEEIRSLIGIDEGKREIIDRIIVQIRESISAAAPEEQVRIERIIREIEGTRDNMTID